MLLVQLTMKTVSQLRHATRTSHTNTHHITHNTTTPQQNTRLRPHTHALLSSNFGRVLMIHDNLAIALGDESGERA